MLRLFSLLFLVFISAFGFQAYAAPTNELRLTAAQSAEAQRFGLTPEQWRKQNALIASLDVEVVRFSRANSVNETTLKAIARELGMRNPQASIEQFLNALRAKAEDVAKLRTEITNLRRSIGQLQNRELRTPAELAMNRAEAALDAGELVKAETELGKLEILRRAESSEVRKLWEDAATRQATVAALRGDLDKSETILFAAKRQSREWAKEENLRAWRMMMQAGGQRYESGDKLGKNEDLERAIVIYREEALPLVALEQYPKEMAETQNDLSCALYVLGYRQSSQQKLEEAIVLLQAALLIRTPYNYPKDWASSQNNLGNIWLELGRLSNNDELFVKALGAYKLSLSQTTRETDKLQWAKAQSDLGTVLTELGKRAPTNTRLIEAETAFRAALSIRTRDSMPLLWARTNVHLASLLAIKGSRENNVETLNVAVKVMNSALEEQKRELVPYEWAQSEIILGEVLLYLNSVQYSQNSIRLAEAAFNNALLEARKDKFPRLWAKAQNGIGNTFAMIGFREIGTQNLEIAAEAYRLALQAITFEKDSATWISIKLNLGYATRLISRRNGNCDLANSSKSELSEGLQKSNETNDIQNILQFTLQIQRVDALIAQTCPH